MTAATCESCRRHPAGYTVAFPGAEDFLACAGCLPTPGQGSVASLGAAAAAPVALHTIAGTEPGGGGDR